MTAYDLAIHCTGCYVTYVTLCCVTVAYLLVAILSCWRLFMF